MLFQNVYKHVLVPQKLKTKQMNPLWKPNVMHQEYRT